MEMHNQLRPITRDHINAFESKHNLKLPESYIVFLLKHNGGVSELIFFPVPGRPDNPEDVASFFYGLPDEGHICEAYYIEYVIEGIEDILPPDLLPIASTWTGSQICLRIRDIDYGQICLWDPHLAHDLEEGEEPGYDNVYFVAVDFEDFLNSLRKDASVG